MSTINNRTRVSFVVYDYDKNFDELSNYLNLTPTATFDGSSPTEGIRRWELDSGVDENSSLETHLTAILSLLAPSTEQLKNVTNNYKCMITVGIDYYQFNPEIVFEPTVLSGLASLNAQLWLDIYNYWDGESDHENHN